MPRGRHRHSPPLHRLLPPSAIAGVSLVCAFGPWVFSSPAALRVVAAFAAATAVVGAAVMRRWDAQAGKQVADLTRARASDEWRHEERVAELEADLDESRELRTKLEQRLRAKRAELAGLRNEHAALLRRYATAETERASALEGRRLLEIEAGEPTPTRALPPVPAQGAKSPKDAEAVAASAADGEAAADADDKADGKADGKKADGKAETSAVFSPEGSQLFLRAKAALEKFDEDSEDSEDDFEDDFEGGFEEDLDEAFEEDEDLAGDGDGSPEGDAGVSAEGGAEDGTGPEDDGSPKGDGPGRGDGPGKGVGPGRTNAAKGGPVRAKTGTEAHAADTAAKGAAEPVATVTGAAEDDTEAAAQEDEAQGQPEAVDGHERAAATTPARTPAPSAQQPSGHFVEPTAVAVVPAAPVRRPSVEGGFDFFGTKNESSSGDLESVQNEDLADVVGQEALALHKAEAEADFKPADEESRGVGQVIDLTAHDETEQIDLQGLRGVRSAVS
ncbi:hypothetical protein [Streptomyces sp. NPDC001759]